MMLISLSCEVQQPPEPDLNLITQGHVDTLHFLFLKS